MLDAALQLGGAGGVRAIADGAFLIPFKLAGADGAVGWESHRNGVWFALGCDGGEDLGYNFAGFDNAHGVVQMQVQPLNFILVVQGGT